MISKNFLKHKLLTLSALAIALSLIVFLPTIFSYLKSSLPPSKFFQDISVAYHLISNDSSALSSILQNWNFLESRPWFNFDSTLWYLPTLFTNLIFSNPWLSIKITQIIQLAISFLGVFLLVKKNIKNNAIAILGGILFATTPHFLRNLIEATSLAWSYATLPFCLLAIQVSFQKYKISTSIFTGIIISLATIYLAPQYIFYTGIPLAIFALIQFFPFTKKSTLTLATILVSFLLTGSFFLTNFFFESSPYAQFEEELVYRKNPTVVDFYTPSIFEIITFQNKEENIDKEPAKSPAINILPILIILAGFLSLYKNNQDKKLKIALLVSGIIAAILSYGLHGFLFNFFRKIIPYFFSIRAPGRFATSFILSFILLTTFSLSKIKAKKYLYTSAYIILLLLSLYSFYFYNHKIQSFEATTQDEINTLFPDHQEISRKINNFDFRTIDTSLSNESPHHLNYYASAQRTVLNPYDLIFKLKNDNLSKIFGILNIKYILTPTSTKQSFLDTQKIISQKENFNKIHENEIVTLWENRAVEERKYLADPYIVYGGPKTINLARTEEAFIFAEQEESREKISKIENDFNTIHFYTQSTILDLISSQKLSEEKAFFLNHSESSWKTIKQHDYPIKLDFGSTFNSNFYNNSIFGDNIISPKGSLYTEKQDDTNFHFSVENENDYLIFARVKTDPFNKPSFSLNKQDPKTMHLENFSDFQWTRLTEKNLTKGEHILNIANKQNTPIYLDTILIIEKDYFEKTKNDILNNKSDTPNSNYLIYSKTPPSSINLLDTENNQTETTLEKNDSKNFYKKDVKNERIKLKYNNDQPIDSAQLSFKINAQKVTLKIYFQEQLQKTIEISKHEEISQTINLRNSSQSTQGNLAIEIIKNENSPENIFSFIDIANLTLLTQTIPFCNTQKENFCTFPVEIFKKGTFELILNQELNPSIKEKFTENSYIDDQKIIMSFSDRLTDATLNTKGVLDKEDGLLYEIHQDRDQEKITLNLERGIHHLHIPKDILIDESLKQIILKDQDTATPQKVLVSTELYSPNWKIKDGKEKLPSFPTNIFTNGFATSKIESRPYYSRNLPSKIALILSFLPILALIILKITEIFKNKKSDQAKSKS